MAGIDINRTTTNVINDPEISQEIWGAALEESFFMSHARRITLPGEGVKIQTITGEPTANWVAETNAKPVSTHTFGTKTMTPYKIAVIELFSNEFRRDFAALYRELVRRLPYAIGAKFDATVFGGTAPGTGFDVLTNATAVGIGGTGTYGKLVTAYTTVGTAGTLNGWAISPQGEGILLSATDGNSRPLLIDSANSDGAVTRLLGARVERSGHLYKAGTPNVVGYAGDWSQARYGTVDGINVAISEEATINTGTEQVNLWQRNMFAVRAEAEVGFIVKSASAFVKLTDATN